MTDPLADVFPDTADAPLPIGDIFGCPSPVGVTRLYPHPSDTRWKPRPRRALSRAEIAEIATNTVQDGSL